MSDEEFLNPTRNVRTVSVLALVYFVLVFASAVWQPAIAQGWAFEESYDGLDPDAPSQTLLPKTFDYSVTHRIHPRDMLARFRSYPADHGDDCAGPAPPVPATHEVETSHISSGAKPDKSFYVCKQHMMSTMGDVSGYSVTSFWPKQEFDFARGGVLEFDVNVNENPGRFWWEIVIAPRSQLKVASAEDFWPIDERYPKDRIRLSWGQQGQRGIGVGRRLVAPAGWQVNERDWRGLRDIDGSDPAITDRRIRRKMRVVLAGNRIHWDMQLADGSYDRYSVTVPGGLPITRGLVLFKTHAYTPHKASNYNFTTWHWDNIRFTGPKIPPYRNYETEQLVYLQANGNRPIGDTRSVQINLPEVGTRPRLFGQVHSPLRGQVRLRVNGNPIRVVHPHDYMQNNCESNGWGSFLVDIPANQLKAGANIFQWIVGPRPGCAQDHSWNGFSVKDLEVQFDGATTPVVPAVPAELIRLEAEDYAEVRGWYDRTRGNSYRQYRTDDVDIARSALWSNAHTVSRIQAGEFLEYDFRVENANRFDLFMYYTSNQRVRGRVRVFMDGVSVGVMTLPKSPSQRRTRWSLLRNLRLTEGTHRLRLRFLSSGMSVDRMILRSKAVPGV